MAVVKAGTEPQTPFYSEEVAAVAFSDAPVIPVFDRVCDDRDTFGQSISVPCPELVVGFTVLTERWR
jgi:hypothetical protein